MTYEQASGQPMVNRIFPRNLTAEAAYNVLGNPPSTRPESGVANCFPGLEYDHRTLDCRFFPGLDVVYLAQGTALGVRVMTVDPNENTVRRPPAEYASIARTLRPQLGALAAQLSADTPWFVWSLEQAGTRIALVDETGAHLDGLTAWRLVRSLRPGPVTLVVRQRPPDQPVPPDQPPQTIQLDGWRRTYTDPRTGVIDATYQPGELTQSLCSPWQHDFRDCSCTYWASNHPDIVFPAVPRDEPTQPGGLPTDPAEQIRISWLRDPDVAEVHGQALPSQRDNRPFEASYFQINHRWQDLSIVLEGRETEGSYIPRSAARDQAVPFSTNDELWDRIVELAGLEHLVTLLYLYALFSVIEPEQAPEQAPERGAGRWPTLADDVTFTRSVLLEVATSEMQHLRWANHLLWGLAGAIGHPYEPAVVPPALALPAPPGGAPRPAQLAPLTLDTLALFVDIERSSAYIDGQYARVTATLRQPGYPTHLYQLASNIAEEGEEHFLYFRDLQLLLSPYGEQDPVYLRPVRPGDPAQPDIGAALDDYRQILTLLETGYQLGDRQNQQALAQARTAMFGLQSRAEQLARQGHGIPFFAPWQQRPWK